VALGDWGGGAGRAGRRARNWRSAWSTSLKDKAPAAMALGGDLAAARSARRDPAPAVATPVPATIGAAQAEALSALQNLGYAPAEAARAVAEAAGTSPEAGTPEMIRRR
jgi:Holliday junction DNA helicase RuvA